MPLLDHFHPPLQGHRHWEGFHGWWAAAIAGSLNEHLLPPEYFAEFQVTVGTRIEVDVATFTEDGAPERFRPNGASHGRPDTRLDAARACGRGAGRFSRTTSRCRSSAAWLVPLWSRPLNSSALGTRIATKHAGPSPQNAPPTFNGGSG